MKQYLSNKKKLNKKFSNFETENYKQMFEQNINPLKKIVEELPFKK